MWHSALNTSRVSFFSSEKILFKVAGSDTSSHFHTGVALHVLWWMMAGHEIYSKTKHQSWRCHSNRECGQQLQQGGIRTVSLPILFTSDCCYCWVGFRTITHSNNWKFNSYLQIKKQSFFTRNPYTKPIKMSQFTKIYWFVWFDLKVKEEHVQINSKIWRFLLTQCLLIWLPELNFSK